jgi:hypothetical protein
MKCRLVNRYRDLEVAAVSEKGLKRFKNLTCVIFKFSHQSFLTHGVQIICAKLTLRVIIILSTKTEIKFYTKQS